MLTPWMRQICNSAEWKWWWDWWDVPGKVAQVISFWPVLERHLANKEAEKPMENFDFFCRIHTKFPYIQKIKNNVRVEREWVYFTLNDKREIFLPYWLWNECDYQNANKNYSLEVILWIFRIFDPNFKFPWVNRYYDEPIWSFFKHIMRWKHLSIWIGEEQNIPDEWDTLLHRAQWLTRDGHIVGWNLPDNFSWVIPDEISEWNNVSESRKAIFFAWNGIVIMDYDKETAYTIPN